MNEEEFEMLSCDNTDCHKHKTISNKFFDVVLTEDFDGDECIWCENCCKVDGDMIETKTEIKR